MKKFIALILLSGLIPACTFAEVYPSGAISIRQPVATGDIVVFKSRTEIGSGGAVSNVVTQAQLATTDANLAALQIQFNEATAYGNIYIHDGTNTVPITNATNYFPITGFTTNGSSNTVCTSSNITISAGAGGKYMIGNFVSFNGQNSGVYEGAVFINGEHNMNGEWSRTMGAAAAIGSAGTYAIYTLAEGDVIDSRITCDVYSTLPEIRQASLTVTKITGLKGDTGDPTSIITQTVTDSTNEVPSGAALTDALSGKLDVTDGSATNLTVSNLTVLGTATLPSPFTIEEMSVTSLTGSGVSAMKENRIFPKYGIGTYAYSTGIAGFSSYYGVKVTNFLLTVANAMYLYPSSYATNIIVRGRFGEVGSETNMGVNIRWNIKSTESDGSLRYIAPSGVDMNATNGLFTVNMPVPALFNGETSIQVAVNVHTNTTDTALIFPTNNVWFLDFTEQY